MDSETVETPSDGTPTEATAADPTGQEIRLNERVTAVETVGQMWEDFDRQVLPVGCSKIQKQETRRAFFAGAYALLQTCLGVLADPACPDEVGERVLSRWQAECEAFYEQVGRGRA